MNKDIRKKVMQLSYDKQSQHIGSVLSCIDIMWVLYDKILKFNPENINDINRDYFILSKGHAGLGLYIILEQKGFDIDLDKFEQNNSYLSGHVSHFVPGIEFTCGSLGYGLGLSAGIALGLKLDNKKNYVYCLLGDGECDEGSIWESARFIIENNLNNLIVIIDNNNLQALPKNMDYNYNLYKKWKAFGFNTIKVDGHNELELQKVFKSHSKKPKCIIAKTIKGKGVSFMQNKCQWHYYNLNTQQYQIAMKELSKND